MRAHEVIMLVNGIAVNAHVHTPLAGVCYQWSMAGFSCAVRAPLVWVFDPLLAEIIDTCF